jgi:hypothetical protein
LRKEFRYEDGVVVTEAALPGIADSVRRQYGAFGALPLDELPTAAMARPEWKGRVLVTGSIPDGLTDRLELAAGTRTVERSLPTGVCPLLVQGTVDPDVVPNGAQVLAAAVNGIVMDSCRLITRPDGVTEFHLMLPESAANQPAAMLELFAAPSDNVNEWTCLYRGAL